MSKPLFLALAFVTTLSGCGFSESRINPMNWWDRTPEAPTLEPKLGYAKDPDDNRIEIAQLKEAMPDRTMIYVTHDQVEAMTMADKIVVLNAGRIEQVGSPLELYRNPANLFVAGFLGAPSMNFIDVTVQAVNGTKALVSNAALDPVER